MPSYAVLRRRQDPIGGWSGSDRTSRVLSVTHSGAARLPIELARSGGLPALLRSPAVAIVAIAAVMTAPLIVLSILDVASQRTLWDNLQWTVAAPR